MDELVTIRGYHSVSLLLPSGKVLVAGGDGNPRIEIFSPPYLFHGPRPVIASSPDTIHHGQTFSIDTPDADSIARIVLVRPMAVTHQTDTEQRVIEMPFSPDPVQPGRLLVTAPDGGFPHSLAPQGFYMLYLLNREGVPSEASWIALASSHRFTVLDRTPIASLRRHDDHMELWVVDAFGVVRGNWWNGNWHDWYSLLNPNTKFPPRGHLAVLGRHRNHMEVFGIGTDGQLHGIWWDGTNWRDWYSLPGATFPASAPLAVHCRHDDHMEIWGIDETGMLRGNWWNGAWQGLYQLPTPIPGFSLVPGGNVAALGRHGDHMEVWSIGTDDRLHGIWWDGNWRDWYTLGGLFSFPPGAPLSAIARNDDYMDVWAVGDDDRLHGVWWNGSWRPWYTLNSTSVPRKTPLAALSRNDDHMEVWCVAPDDPRPFVWTVHGVWWDGSWKPFYRLG
jgi:Domain of unknown function (DUF1929)